MPSRLPRLRARPNDVAQTATTGLTSGPGTFTPQYKVLAHFRWGLEWQWFAERNRQLHERGVKVVGHMNVKFLVGDPDGPEGPRGFFHFYKHLWDEQKLGPRPVDDPLQLLERNAQGEPIVNNSYSIGGMKEYWACLNNPAWRQVLKAWTRNAVDQQVDGLMINYFTATTAIANTASTASRTTRVATYARANQSPIGIDDLQQHVFPEIVGWHDPARPRRYGSDARWSQIANKEAFDEVFVRMGAR